MASGTESWEGGEHPTVPRCAFPGLAQPSRPGTTASGTRPRGHHTEGQAAPIPGSPPDASSVQGGAVTLGWVEISNRFEQHLK